jgi:hypothetical protein
MGVFNVICKFITFQWGYLTSYTSLLHFNGGIYRHIQVYYISMGVFNVIYKFITFQWGYLTSYTSLLHFNGGI